MEFNKVEALVIEEVVTNAETQIKDLNDLQLALIGGGNGVVVFG